MFTGIIEEVGQVSSISRGRQSVRLRIKCRIVTQGSMKGDSIAVNGVCLTVTEIGADWFTADVMPETLRRTSFHILRSGSPVNLERAMKPDGRLGGHLVSGHIDGIAVLTRRTVEDNAIWLTFSAPSAILRHILLKGSVCLDGVSLTVAGQDQASFSVSLVPHTVKKTSLNTRTSGDPVNVECDLIGKYVEKHCSVKSSLPTDKTRSGLTIELLEENGF